MARYSHKEILDRISVRYDAEHTIATDRFRVYFTDNKAETKLVMDSVYSFDLAREINALVQLWSE